MQFNAGRLIKKFWKIGIRVARFSSQTRQYWRVKQPSCILLDLYSWVDVMVKVYSECHFCIRWLRAS